MTDRKAELTHETLLGGQVAVRWGQPMEQFWIHDRGLTSGIWFAHDEHDALLRYVQNQGHKTLEDKARSQNITVDDLMASIHAERLVELCRHPFTSVGAF